MKHLRVPMEIKATGDTGVFSGYASIFGNVDLGGDVISKDEPFKEIVMNSAGKVKTLFQHDAGGGGFMKPSSGAGGLPIGLATVSQNSKGLKFDGQLVMEDPFVQRVHAHMKAGTLDGMSIGYDVLPGGAKILESGVRELNALKLWEISVVTFGMNPKASIDVVKSAGQIENIKDFEDFLREAGGFSRARAKRLASGGWGRLSGQREVGNEGAPQPQGSAKALLDYLNSISSSAESHT